MRPYSTRALLAVVLLATIPLAASCASRSSGLTAAQELRLSPKLNPFVYFESGKVVFVGVDGRAAQFHKVGAVFPLGLGLANESGESITFDREGISLEDSEGNVFPLVSYEEYTREYERSTTADARLIDSFREILALRFQNYARQPWPLYPTRGSSVPVADRFELGRRQYAFGYVYFPVPTGGIHGKTFTLLVRTKEHPDPFLVDFAIR